MELFYSRDKVRYTFFIACLLTAMITGVSWMFLSLMGSKYISAITLVIASVFFVFCSAAMLWRFYKREVVFAVRETGLLDKRWSSKIIGWDEIKEVALLRREQEFFLEVRLWPQRQGAAGESKLVDLSDFDAGIEDVIAQIERFTSVRHELR